MKNSVNKVTLRGFVGQAPEVRQYATEKSVARVSLATSENYKKGNGDWVTETQWHSLVFWGKWASFAELNLKKGSLVEVEGKLVNRSYTDGNGVKRFVTEVVVSTAKEVQKEE